MLTERDLQELDLAASLIIKIIERHRVHEEDAAERRALFRFVEPNPAKEENESEFIDLQDQGFVIFNEKEIQQMPKKIQKLIIVNRKRCRLRTKQTGKNTFTYEIRFRSDGYNLSASGKTVELAKKNMLEKLRSAIVAPKGNTNYTSNGIPFILSDFSFYYFEKFRKPKVAHQTYKNDMHRLKNHILPALGALSIKKITPFECEKLLASLKEAGKGKTADEVHSLLSIIFKGAIAHKLIDQNPLDIVPHVQHVRKHGKSLTPQEERQFLETIRGTQFEIVYSISLFTGLRPNELKTATIQNDFIVSVNSKQHIKETVYKRIPICKRLRYYLELVDYDLTRAIIFSEGYLSTRFPKFCPNHKFYDLRTTFYSRAQELGVELPALKAFVGHSNGKLGNAYTNLSDEYLLKEGKKLDHWE